MLGSSPEPNPSQPWNLGGLQQGCRTWEGGPLFPGAPGRGCRWSRLPPAANSAHHPPRPPLPPLAAPPRTGPGSLGVPSRSLPEVVLLALLRRWVATAPGPLALLPGGGFGGTWGPTSWALPIHYMAFLRAGRGWRWGWGPGVKLAEGPMSSFCHQEVERATEVSNGLPPPRPVTLLTGSAQRIGV